MAADKVTYTLRQEDLRLLDQIPVDGSEVVLRTQRGRTRSGVSEGALRRLVAHQLIEVETRSCSPWEVNERGDHFRSVPLGRNDKFTYRSEWVARRLV